MNDGYGTAAARATAVITVSDLSTSRLRDFPDSPFLAGARQSYFIGLAFTSDDHYLYASVASITDPIDEKRGDTWNGIVVYRFDKGKLKPARFIPISPQKLAPGKRVAKELSTSPAGTAVPYPAGLAAISVNGHDELLVANDRSDNVVLLDTQTGKTLQQFDVSTNNVIPASFPYGVVAKRDGTRAWCSLWNASKVGGLDPAPGMCWISLLEPKDPTLPGSHPTALMLDEDFLDVTLSNADAVAVVDTASGAVDHLSSTQIAHQEYPGAYPSALAQSADGKLHHSVQPLNNNRADGDSEPGYLKNLRKKRLAPWACNRSSGFAFFNCLRQRLQALSACDIRAKRLPIVSSPVAVVPGHNRSSSNLLIVRESPVQLPY